MLYFYMTAEIVIMNREAIAIAADSAVTWGSEENNKIFTSANKIFSLSNSQPIAIMIYNNASFGNIPWETIIKLYRQNNKSPIFDTIEECRKDFLKYLESFKDIITPEQRISYYITKIDSFYQILIKIAVSKINEKASQTGKLDEKENLIIIDEIIDFYWNTLKELPNIPQINEEEVEKISVDFEKYAKKLIAKYFSNMKFSDETLNKLFDIGIFQIIKFPNPKYFPVPGVSGIVITGFGKKEIFPSLISFHVDGILQNDKLKYLDFIKDKISFENGSLIIPFAQDDMVHAFMDGIFPSFFQAIIMHISELLENYPKIIIDSIKELKPEIKEKYKNKFSGISEEKSEFYKTRLLQYQAAEFSNEIAEVVSMLPKNELADMAETLVNLTSFRKRVTKASETVGGPIDVAVISKGDGFVWIKRKYYFNKELNPRFMRKISGENK